MSCIDCCMSIPSAELSYVVAFRELVFRRRNDGISIRSAHEVVGSIVRTIATPLFAAMDVCYHTGNFMFKAPIAPIKVLFEEVFGLGEDTLLPKEFSFEQVVEHELKAVICSIVLIASLVLGIFYPQDALRLSAKLSLTDNTIENIRDRVGGCIDNLKRSYGKYFYKMLDALK